MKETANHVIVFQALPDEVLDFKAKIDLTNPDRDYHIVEYYGNQQGKPSEEPVVIYFGQWVSLIQGCNYLNTNNVRCLLKFCQIDKISTSTYIFNDTEIL